ncbi:YpoC family protein [Pradoshia sp.]
MRRYDVLQFSYNQLQAESLGVWDVKLLDFGFPYDELGNGYEPWQDFASVQADLWDEWEAVAEGTEERLAKRQTKEIGPYMQKGIVLFLSILFWSNKTSVHLDNLEEEIRSLPHKPVNVDERISYILNRPNTYPAYMQLKSLMDEQKKMVAKLIALKKL